MTQSNTPVPAPVNRREFLNYAWLSSMVLLLAQAGGVSIFFAFPNFREGEFGGIFTLGLAGESLPESESAPVPYGNGKFWLTHLDQGGADEAVSQGVAGLEHGDDFAVLGRICDGGGGGRFVHVGIEGLVCGRDFGDAQALERGEELLADHDQALANGLVA